MTAPTGLTATKADGDDLAFSWDMHHDNNQITSHVISESFLVNGERIWEVVAYVPGGKTTNVVVGKDNAAGPWKALTAGATRNFRITGRNACGELGPPSSAAAMQWFEEEVEPLPAINLSVASTTFPYTIEWGHSDDDRIKSYNLFVLDKESKTRYLIGQVDAPNKSYLVEEDNVDEEVKQLLSNLQEGDVVTFGITVVTDEFGETDMLTVDVVATTVISDQDDDFAIGQDEDDEELNTEDEDDDNLLNEDEDNEE